MSDYKVKTQKIYTFPDRELYGEYCSTSLLELRIKIVKGEIKDELCFLDENGRAYCFDEYGIPESFPSFYLEEINTNLLRELLNEQMKKRKDERL
jgi:hypothetical protein